jgi:tRNA(Ile2) C34 agmatinyltransferase TiaS
MINIKRNRTNRFEYYIRQCDLCNKFFKSSTKKRSYCDKCKMKINKMKIKNSIKKRLENKLKRNNINVITRLHI